MICILKNDCFLILNEAKDSILLFLLDFWNKLSVSGSFTHFLHVVNTYISFFEDVTREYIVN